jgi:hypothetical protein
LPRRWFFILVLLLVPLAAQEAMFRFVFPLPEILNFNRSLYTADQHTRGFMMWNAFRWNSWPDRASFVVNLNGYGFRGEDPDIERRPGTDRVLFIGDSFTEGFMATDDETIPRGFARAARSGGWRLEALNLGMGAADISNYSVLARDAVPLFRPDAVVLIIYADDLLPVAFGPDWWSDPIRPVRLNRWMPRAIQVIRRRLAREPVPRRWRSEPEFFIPVVPHPANPWSDPARAGLYAAFVDPGMAEAMRRGGLNPFLVNYLSYQENVLQWSVDVTKPLSAFRDYVTARKASMFVVFIPYSTQVSDYYVPFMTKFSRRKDIRSLRGPKYRRSADALRRSCALLGIPFYDTTPLLVDLESRGRHAYWEYDGHLRGNVYLLLGQAVYKWWNEESRAASPRRGGERPKGVRSTRPGLPS